MIILYLEIDTQSVGRDCDLEKITTSLLQAEARLRPERDSVPHLDPARPN